MTSKYAHLQFMFNKTYILINNNNNNNNNNNSNSYKKSTSFSITKDKHISVPQSNGCPFPDGGRLAFQHYFMPREFICLQVVQILQPFVLLTFPAK